MSADLSPQQMLELADLVAEKAARRVVELMRSETPAAEPPAWIDAADVAARYGVSRAYVYEHADDLGAVRLGEAGDGRKPRLRFDPAVVAAHFAPVRAPTDEPGETPAARRAPAPRQTGATTTAGGARLLEIKAARS